MIALIKVIEFTMQQFVPIGHSFKNESLDLVLNGSEHCE